MATRTLEFQATENDRDTVEEQLRAGQPADVGLLTGGQDRHYAAGLATALASQGIALDVIGSDDVDGSEMRSTAGIRFLNLHGSCGHAGALAKLKRILLAYVRLMRYAASSQVRVVHILWNNRVEFFDRTLLMLYYKSLGKKAVLTAHNVNAGRRDSRDSVLNRLTLRIQYALADHIFVHTRRMKEELVQRFYVDEDAVSVIPYGINNAIPDTDITRAEARLRLGLESGDKVVLAFGAIKPYKGLEYLVAAFQSLAATGVNYRLIIAGEQKKGSEDYLARVQQTIERDSSRKQVIQKIGFIADEETELYFKAADVAALPYTDIFQSGILFMAFSFGLPVVASDVGSFREDVRDGETGFICRSRDPRDLAAALKRYFESDLYQHLDRRRQEIRSQMLAKHSWEEVATLTRNVYSRVLATPLR